MSAHANVYIATKMRKFKIVYADLFASRIWVPSWSGKFGLVVIGASDEATMSTGSNNITIFMALPVIKIK